ncbi:hypothetical protein Tco_1273076 [Tanacetum coccineum]
MMVEVVVLRLLRRAEVVRVVVRVGGGWRGSGDEGWFRLAAAGSGCPMCVVIDGEVWGGQRRLMVRGWLREGGVEVAAMVMLVTYGGEEGDDGVVVRGDGVRWRCV